MTEEVAARIARAWAFREKTELEAADLFDRLALDLQSANVDKAIVRMARDAALDEREHALLCREVIDLHDSATPDPRPHLGVYLGPERLSVADRALYASVAMSCITETLSTALLLEIRKHAEPRFRSRVVRKILRDEVSHSRLGWAHLSSYAQHNDPRWLSVHVLPMIRASLREDVLPISEKNVTDSEMLAFGILPSEVAREISHRTVDEVILPGLVHFGIRPIKDVPRAVLATSD